MPLILKQADDLYSKVQLSTNLLNLRAASDQQTSISQQVTIKIAYPYKNVSRTLFSQPVKVEGFLDDLSSATMCHVNSRLPFTEIIRKFRCFLPRSTDRLDEKYFIQAHRILLLFQNELEPQSSNERYFYGLKFVSGIMPRPRACLSC